PRRHRSAVETEVTSSPRKRTRPRVGACAPTSRLSKVVFPAPFGPTTPTASPADTEKSTPSRTTRAPKLFVSPVASSRTPSERMPGIPDAGARSAVERPEFRLDGNIRVGGVLGHRIVERELRA